MSSSDVGPTTTSEKRALSVEKEVVFSSKYTIRKICFKSDKFIPSGKSSVFTRNPNPGLKPGFLKEIGLGFFNLKNQVPGQVRNLGSGSWDLGLRPRPQDPISVSKVDKSF